MLLPQISKKIVISCLVIASSFLLVAHAHALTVSPARLELSGDPGATVGGQFTLINEQATTETFYPSYENFSAQGENGSPAFSNEKSGLDTWTTVGVSQVTLTPGQIAHIPYTITIPKDAEPGGYFAAIFWSPSSPAQAQVSIGAKIGLLVLLRVNGNIAEQAGITSFDRNGHGFFYTTLPVDFRYKFGNQGGDRIEPKGTITIRDTIFLPAAHLDANVSEGNILPSSVRLFSVEWLKHEAPLPIQGFFSNVSYEWHNFAVGLYSAHLNLSYGTKGLRASKTVWFFVMPWQLVLCVIVVVLLVWWIGKSLLRRYNRYIIRQSQLQSHNNERS